MFFQKYLIFFGILIPISSGQWFWNRIQFRTENGFCEPNYNYKKAIFSSKMNSVPKSLTRWNGYYIKWVIYVCTSNFSLHHPKKPGRFSIMREVMIYLRVNDLLLSRITSTITPIPLWKAIDHNPQSKSLPLIKSLPPFEMNILPSLSTSLFNSEAL